MKKIIAIVLIVLAGSGCSELKHKATATIIYNTDSFQAQVYDTVPNISFHFDTSHLRPEMITFDSVNNYKRVQIMDSTGVLAEMVQGRTN